MLYDVLKIKTTDLPPFLPASSCVLSLQPAASSGGTVYHAPGPPPAEPLGGSVPGFLPSAPLPVRHIPQAVSHNTS